MDERTNVLLINALEFRHLSWREWREVRCMTVLDYLLDIFPARDGARYRVEH